MEKKTDHNKSMRGKTFGMAVLVVAGIYFLLFHTEPFPFNHNSVGLPPYHTLHAIFGALLLFGAGRLWKKK